MIKLNDRVWKPFRIGQLFNIKKGKRLTKANSNCGKTPYLSSKNNNNNLDRFISEDPIFNGGQITVNSNGSVGASFYHAYDFWASDNTNVLEPLFSINEYIALFICTSMNLNSFRFGFGRLYSLSHINQDSVGLPSTDSGEPDWQFMEDYIKQFEETKLLEIQETDYKDNVTLPSVDEWGSFRLGELFEIKGGYYQSRPSSESEDGIPYISSSDNNNAVNRRLVEEDLAFVDRDGKPSNTMDGKIYGPNTMTMAMSGSVGNVFFHEYRHTMYSRVSSMIPRFEINKYIGLFLKVVIETEKFKYSYGRIQNMKRLKGTEIKLPVKVDGQPDWQLMERYMRSLPYSEMI